MTHPSFTRTDKLVSWGRVVREPHLVAKPKYPDELAGLIDAFSPDKPGLAIGLRRSYGESNLNPDGYVIDMTGMDRLISFNRDTGLLRAEAGVSLSDCLQVLVRAGWFLPTSPGTRFVTLGGAVANDVHGKNHYLAGTFGASVTKLGLRRSDGSISELEPGAPMFHATVGGMGLTGVIEWVEFQASKVPSAWFDAEDIVFGDIQEYFDIAREKHAGYEYTMAWVDCLATGDTLGRGIFSCGNWSAKGGYRPHQHNPKIGVPLDVPGFALNTYSVKAFNSAYNALKKSQAGASHPHYEPFIYPLDAVSNWNRLYGGKGFYQYQCVIPPASARDATADLLQAISASGQGSFLAVLKDFGSMPTTGLMSFPMEGTTLALDFPNKGARTLRLMSELDVIVRQAGGRLYPAKDGRMSSEMFREGFPQWEAFREFIDPEMTSKFWKRMIE